jgi:hypothetical protein
MKYAPQRYAMSNSAAVYADAMRVYGVAHVAHWMRISGHSLTLALQAVRLAHKHA